MLVEREAIKIMSHREMTPVHHTIPPCRKNPTLPGNPKSVSVKVSMHGGKVVDAVIKAVIDRTDGLHYQIDFGNERTALDALRQLLDVHFPTGRFFIQRPAEWLHLVEPHSDLTELVAPPNKVVVSRG